MQTLLLLTDAALAYPGKLWNAQVQASDNRGRDVIPGIQRRRLPSAECRILVRVPGQRDAEEAASLYPGLLALHLCTRMEDQSMAVTAHSFCHLFTKYPSQVTFKATMVFHVGLTILLLFSFHQKTSPKGHWKRLTGGVVSMEIWAEHHSSQLSRPPPPELLPSGVQEE
ncbi:hypothetical protein LEMLEM_LOCUS12980 [Lemmus lemmus]